MLLIGHRILQVGNRVPLMSIGILMIGARVLLIY